METIRVNMTPCEDIKTIHASQNDNEAREWGFELHNNGEKIDSSSISDQLVFKVYEGGTEEILPTNGSTPATSPFKGDIRYPQGLLSDQEFLYRESPTEEDGLAKITDIKGNTLVWNQMLNDSFNKSLVNFTLSGHTYTFDFTSTTNTNWWQYQIYSALEYTAIANHKYLVKLETKSDYPVGNVVFNGDRSILPIGTLSDGYTKRGAVFTSLTSATTRFYFRPVGNTVTANFHYENIFVRNIQLFDLTKMFGSGNEPTTVEEFTSLFSLPYYDYNQGTLLSFNGNGIKTVSEDESEESTLSLPISTYFPNGMKSAGSVYDELTETKAITRIGAVNMGTLSWTRNANYEFFYATLTDGAIFTGAEDKDLLCPIYTTETTVNSTSLMSNVNDKTIRGRRGIASCQIYIKDTSYTSATDLVNALQGIPLYYELATPTETSFTTASLVTENAEIPLSNNDGVLIGKCTEQLSSESGFFDAKIKLADEDGECYSNKIQLHIERSPQ